jgi:uncharacterized membrane protein YkvA (DUF1232 family)
MSKKRMLSWVAQIGLITGMISQFKLAWKLFRDDRVPRTAKAIPLLAILAVVSPLGWVLNLIPVAGQMGDLAVIALGVNSFVKAAPQDVVHEYMTELHMDHPTK